MIYARGMALCCWFLKGPYFRGARDWTAPCKQVRVVVETRRRGFVGDELLELCIRAGLKTSTNQSPSFGADGRGRRPGGQTELTRPGISEDDAYRVALVLVQQEMYSTVHAYSCRVTFTSPLPDAMRGTTR